jgi:hypothetical protein
LRSGLGEGVKGQHQEEKAVEGCPAGAVAAAAAAESQVGAEESFSGSGVRGQASGQGRVEGRKVAGAPWPAVL